MMRKGEKGTKRQESDIIDINDGLGLQEAYF